MRQRCEIGQRDIFTHQIRAQLTILDSRFYGHRFTRSIERDDMIHGFHRNQIAVRIRDGIERMPRAERVHFIRACHNVAHVLHIARMMDLFCGVGVVTCPVGWVMKYRAP